MLITTLQYKQSLPNNRASAQPRSSHRASGAPRIVLRLRETPYTTLLVFPGLYPKSRPLSYPARAGILNTRKGLTLRPGLVRRPQHLPFGCQLRSPERSTHDSLSIYRNADLFLFGKPPSRTLLLSGGGLPDKPRLLSATDHSHVFIQELNHNPTTWNQTLSL